MLVLINTGVLASQGCGDQTGGVPLVRTVGRCRMGPGPGRALIPALLLAAIGIGLAGTACRGSKPSPAGSGPSHQGSPPERRAVSRSLSRLDPLGDLTRPVLEVGSASSPVEREACACPCARSPVGEHHPFRRSNAAAFALNREGRELYRARRWPEAQAKYRAALVADPAFLGPRLNLACALAQEERFPEAVAEAARLAQTAFVPWAREIREAADLAPLQVRPELETLESALASAGRRWGAELRGGFLFLARRRPPVRIPGPEATGVLHLGLEQEILAWLPARGSYRQVTAEEGRVLGFVRSPDGRIVDYVRAGRLVRTSGRPPVLRALSLRRLDLETMALGPAVPITADLVELRIESSGPGEPAVISLDTGAGVTERVFDGRALSSRVGVRPAATGPRDRPWLRLTASGVKEPSSETWANPCRFTADQVARSAIGPSLRIRAPGRQPFWLEAPFGAGLRGMPFP
jgi:hypothetical protein